MSEKDSLGQLKKQMKKRVRDSELFHEWQLTDNGIRIGIIPLLTIRAVITYRKVQRRLVRALRIVQIRVWLKIMKYRIMKMIVGEQMLAALARNVDDVPYALSVNKGFQKQVRAIQREERRKNKKAKRSVPWYSLKRDLGIETPPFAKEDQSRRAGAEQWRIDQYDQAIKKAKESYHRALEKKNGRE